MSEPSRDELVPIDGARDGESVALRTALAMAMATGRGFEIKRFGERRPQPGLRPEHVAAVRAAALLCDAKVGSAFDRSLDLKFEPGPVAEGKYRFELSGADPATLLLQALVVGAATAPGETQLAITGGTHVPDSPAAHYVLRHWAPVVKRLGLDVAVEVKEAGFAPVGGGEIRARVGAWTRPAPALRLDCRGPLVAIRGLSLGARSKGDAAAAQAEAARKQLWESRRLEAEWDVGALSAPSPGAVMMLEAEFENSRAAFCAVADKRTRPEVLGERLARQLLKFLDGEAAVDPWLADQLAVPLAAGRGGGVVTTSEVTPALERVVEVVGQFGCAARLDGRAGLPGRLEVPAW